jgi:branched-chain amino acid transport system permease protein
MWLQLLVSGITVGAIYGLIALGYVTIYRTSRVVNFAQGSFVMLGALVAYSLLEQLGLPHVLAGVIAIAVVVVVGLGTYWLVVAPILRVSLVAIIMATIGVAMVLENLSLLRWGGYPISLPPFTSAEPIRVGGVAILPQSLWVLLILVVVLGALYFLNNHTRVGKQMTATAIDPIAAELSGISTGRIILLAFALSAGIGALAGVAIAPVTPIGFTSGAALGLKGFVAAILGGWGKTTGAVVGGFVLGIAESLATGFLPAGYKDAVAFVVLLLILYFRPRGIVGSSLAEVL